MHEIIRFLLIFITYCLLNILLVILLVVYEFDFYRTRRVY